MSYCEACDAPPGKSDSIIFLEEGEGSGESLAPGGGGGGSAAAAAAAARSKEKPVAEAMKAESGAECPFCGEGFTFSDLVRHSPLCPQLPPRFAGSSAPLNVLAGGGGGFADALQPCQRAALSFVHKHASSAHAAALPALYTKVAKLGLSAASLDKTLAYVRDSAPIVIHFAPELFSKFAADTHYRNQFETGTSKGTLSRVGRTQWENALFCSAYATAADAERVKYGALNTTGDVRGVVPAHAYGKCYFVLKDEVRVRTTFANMDSASVAAAGPGQGLSTCENYAHILALFTEDELKRLLRVGGGGGKDAFTGVAGASTGHYKEAQIHGPIAFKKDISFVVIPGEFKHAHEAAVKAFAAAHGVACIWND